MASNIKVILRLRPCARPSHEFKADLEEGRVVFELDKDDDGKSVNNTRTKHAFRFDGILDMKASQDDVFGMVAKPVIEDVLGGVNGTIFAYGQTGSGKTFTITGGAERYADRGLIPRSIAYMFEAFRSRSARYKMHISYLEVYQNAGYDLLRDDGATRLEDLPKVNIREDEDGNMHLKNLSVCQAASEEEALNLLFMGDTNRVVAETPMNDASTRSHCLFIMWVDSESGGSDVVRRSKLHLVDLAGSERISNTGVTGKLATEAKAINLSLHYLERVIVALHSRSRGQDTHVPYRDSMMTSVLRDSLGGNCRTTMVACAAVESSNIPESISTCSFAQRVAQIKNNAKVNEELDPKLLIARLKRELAELKQEVEVARKSKDGAQGQLTEEDAEQCRALVLQYVSNSTNEPFVCGSVERLRESIRILRDMCLGEEPAGTSGGDAAAAAGRRPPEDPERQAALEEEVRKLRLEIAQRDQEIGVMVQMLSKQRSAEGRPFARAAAPGRPPGRPSEEPAAAELVAASSTSAAAASAAAGGLAPAAGCASAPAAAAPRPPERPGAGRPRAARARGLPAGADAAELLLDEVKALEVFRQTVYRPPASFEENKTALKERIGRAKALGDEANGVRAGITSAKTRLEKLRTERAMTRAGADDGAPLEDGPEERAEVQEIDRLKAIYRERTAELRDVRSEVEHVQRLLEQSKVRMQKEFQTWFSQLRSQASMAVLDDETKRELYARVSNPGGAAQGGTPSASAAAAAAPGSARGAAAAAAQAAPGSARGGGGAQPAAERPSARQAGPGAGAVPAAPPAAAAGAVGPVTGDAGTDDDIAKLYAALGKLTQ